MEKPITDSNNDGFLQLPVDTDVIFSNPKNVYKRQIEKRQRKLLGKISFLQPFLDESEKILLVTTGCSPVSAVEQMLGGAIVYILKRSVFVFTNKRVFHIPTKSNYSFRNSIAEIPYAACQKVFMKRRTLIVEYKNKQKEKFVYIAGRERKKIHSILETIPLEGQQSETPHRTYLCPRCTNRLIKEQYTCPNCSLAFKNKADGRKISIIYPGGGYFYTRHPFLGLVDALAELYLSILVVIFLFGTIRGVEDSAIALIIVGFALALEKTITVYHSNRFIEEYIPKERDIKVNKVFSAPTETAEDFQSSEAEMILTVRRENPT
jgi:hypothetical protein